MNSEYDEIIIANHLRDGYPLRMIKQLGAEQGVKCIWRRFFFWVSRTCSMKV